MQINFYYVFYSFLHVISFILDYFRPRLESTEDKDPNCCGSSTLVVNHDSSTLDAKRDTRDPCTLGDNVQDEEYFRSYADVTIHEEMLRDAVRTNAYRYAILKNYESIRGKVVVDVGAGTGILSIFCVHAGAKHVYAIEASEMAKQTRKIVEENKMADRITVVNKKVEDASLPVKADVIVSEWMGYNLLYESMLQSVLHARDKWLKKDGLMFPSSAELVIAPFTDEDLDLRRAIEFSYFDRLEIWNEMKQSYKVSMESMREYAKHCISNNVHVRCLSPENIISHGVPVCKLDLYKVNQNDLKCIKKEFEFVCFGSSHLHGFVTWFTVSFPGDIQLSTSPYVE
ncbi:hypothetical protein FSP39_021122 [Pinctada imbricata]|uniref:Protein arginine N-methyltransferase 6 n=1 Tax=Pinctada imbricata TaxID=66713 RepID=A0AA89C8E0_PINIB|nr:hypothetical protein FSP39_021122 [Pinctada imbricata]